jgi:gliding motility-associated-like protein
MSGGGNICAGSTTSVNINFTGAAPWSFTYNDGTSNNTISNVSTTPYVITTGTSGNYSLVSVSNAQCSGTTSGTANVNVLSPITISNVSSACNASNTNYTVNFTISGGDPSTYQISGGPGTITSSPPYIFTSDPISSGNPNYSFVVNDVNNCAAQQVNGSQNCNCLASATMSGGGTICSGGSTSISISLTGAAPWSLVYNNGTTNIPVSGINTSPYVITTGTAGNYSMVSVSDANCTGSSGGSAVVTVNPAPSLTVNSPVICQGETANITATPANNGGTYSWMPGGASSQTIAVSPVSSGTYTVTYTLNGCSNTAVSNVTVNPVPIVSVNSQIICEGSNANLQATGASTYLWNDGATSSMITVSPGSSTSYTVTGTSNGCSSTAISNVTVNAIPVITVNSETICDGQSANLTAGGATAYSWSNGDMNSSIVVSPVSTTSYTVTGTSNGCSNSAVSTVTVNSVPVVSVNSPVICEGSSATLTANASVTGGDYLWNPGGIAIQSISVSPAATSTYTVSYSLNNCISTAVATVTVEPLPVITVNSATICEGQSAQLTASGASAYSWSTGDVTNSITVTPSAGSSYTVTGTTNGCSSTAMSIVTVNPIPLITVNSATVCQGQAAVLNASGADTYSWSTGDVTASITVSPSTTTTYTVNGSTNGCTGSASGTVTVNPMPVITVNSPTICSGNTATLTAVTSQGSGNFVWQPGSSTASSIIVSPSSTSTYTVTYTLNSCSTTGTGTVTVNQTPVVSVNSQSICDGSQATLTAIGASTYSWSTGDVTNPINVSPSVSSSYTVTGTTNGCSSSAVSIVSVNQAPAVNINPVSICAGSGTNLTANVGSGGGTYLWSPGNATTSTIYVNPSSTSTYSVTYTLNGCSGTGSGVVTVNPLPVMDPVSDISACVNANIPASNFNSNPLGANYTWINTNSIIGLPLGSNGNTPSFTANNPGSSAITANIEVTPTLNGCAGTPESYTITIHPDPTAFVSGGGIICNGSVATVNISLSGTAPFDLSYTNGTNNYSLTGLNASGYTFNTSDTGSYFVTAISDAHCIGAASGSANVDVHPPLQVSITGTTSICSGASTTLTASASGGDGMPYQFSWGTGGSLGTGNSITVSATSNTSYFVAATDGCTGQANDTIEITMLPSPSVSFNANITSGCVPLCINLTEGSTLSGGSVTSWSWDFGAAGSQNVQNPSVCFNSSGSYSVGLTATGSNGCSSTVMIPDMITVNALPSAVIEAPQVVSVLDPTVQFSCNSTNTTSWFWNFGDVNDPANNTSNLENPSHIYSQPGTYCATLTVQNGAGCTDVIQYCVVVEPEFTFYIPSAFTPNGDGLNDEFYGKGENISEYEMSIYDRWGNLVFFTDTADKHWDGKVENSDEGILMDVFVYKINVKEGDNKQFHNFTGTVTIVK